jgi:hypothetical protein
VTGEDGLDVYEGVAERGFVEDLGEVLDTIQ